MKRRTILAALAAAVALPLAAAEAPAAFRVGYQKSASILVVARQQELLEKRLAELGVAKVEWVEFQFGPPLLEALGSGAVDIGHVGDTPPIFAQAAGANLRYVASAPSVFSGSHLGATETIHNAFAVRGGDVGDSHRGGARTPALRAAS